MVTRLIGPDSNFATLMPIALRTRRVMLSLHECLAWTRLLHDTVIQERNFKIVTLVPTLTTTVAHRTMLDLAIIARRKTNDNKTVSFIVPIMANAATSPLAESDLLMNHIVDQELHNRRIVSETLQRAAQALIIAVLRLLVRISSPTSNALHRNRVLRPQPLPDNQPTDRHVLHLLILLLVMTVNIWTCDRPMLATVGMIQLRTLALEFRTMMSSDGNLRTTGHRPLLQTRLKRISVLPTLPRSSETK